VAKKSSSWKNPSDSYISINIYKIIIFFLPALQEKKKKVTITPVLRDILI
jgi:hypothetical protein